MAMWREKNRRQEAAMERQALLDACDAYDARIDSMGPATDGPIKAAVPGSVAIVDDAAISNDTSIATDEVVVPAVAIGSVPNAVDESTVGDAMPIVESMADTLDNASCAIGSVPITVENSSVAADIPFDQPPGSI